MAVLWANTRWPVGTARLAAHRLRGRRRRQDRRGSTRPTWPGRETSRCDRWTATRWRHEQLRDRAGPGADATAEAGAHGRAAAAAAAGCEQGRGLLQRVSC